MYVVALLVIAVVAGFLAGVAAVSMSFSVPETAAAFYFSGSTAASVSAAVLIMR